MNCNTCHKNPRVGKTPWCQPCLDESEKISDIIDHLTPEQEDKLKEAHAEDYRGTDDDMPDAFEGWLEDLTLDELKQILK